MRRELQRYAAVNARVRTLLPGLLGRRGLESLYSYPSQPAMLDALLSTAYGRTLLSAPHAPMALYGRVITTGRALLALLAEPEREFLRTYLLRYEVENLKLAVRAVCRQLPWSKVAPYVVDLGELATVDVRAAAAAGDVDELAKCLKRTPYATALQWTTLHRAHEAGAAVLEAALDADQSRRTWRAAEHLIPSDQRRVRLLLGIQSDVLNTLRIARHRNASPAATDDLVSALLPSGHWLSADMLRALSAAGGTHWDAAGVPRPIAVVLRDAEEQGVDPIAARLWALLAVEVQRMLSGYPFHIGVPLGLLLAQEMEVRDLQVLLAAKELGVPVEDALERLASVRG